MNAIYDEANAAILKRVQTQEQTPESFTTTEDGISDSGFEYAAREAESAIERQRAYEPPASETPTEEYKPPKRQRAKQKKETPSKSADEYTKEINTLLDADTQDEESVERIMRLIEEARTAYPDKRIAHKAASHLGLKKTPFDGKKGLHHLGVQEILYRVRERLTQIAEGVVEEAAENFEVENEYSKRGRKSSVEPTEQDYANLADELDEATSRYAGDDERLDAAIERICEKFKNSLKFGVNGLVGAADRLGVKARNKDSAKSVIEKIRKHVRENGVGGLRGQVEDDSESDLEEIIEKAESLAEETEEEILNNVEEQVNEEQINLEEVFGIEFTDDDKIWDSEDSERIQVSGDTISWENKETGDIESLNRQTMEGDTRKRKQSKGEKNKNPKHKNEQRDGKEFLKNRIEAVDGITWDVLRRTPENEEYVRNLIQNYKNSSQNDAEDDSRRRQGETFTELLKAWLNEEYDVESRDEPYEWNQAGVPYNLVAYMHADGSFSVDPYNDDLTEIKAIERNRTEEADDAEGTEETELSEEYETPDDEEKQDDGVIEYQNGLIFTLPYVENSDDRAGIIRDAVDMYAYAYRNRHDYLETRQGLKRDNPDDVKRDFENAAKSQKKAFLTGFSSFFLDMASLQGLLDESKLKTDEYRNNDDLYLYAYVDPQGKWQTAYGDKRHKNFKNVDVEYPDFEDEEFEAYFDASAVLTSQITDNPLKEIEESSKYGKFATLVKKILTAGENAQKAREKYENGELSRKKRSVAEDRLKNARFSLFKNKEFMNFASEEDKKDYELARNLFEVIEGEIQDEGREKRFHRETIGAYEYFFETRDFAEEKLLRNTLANYLASQNTQENAREEPITEDETEPQDASEEYVAPKSEEGVVELGSDAGVGFTGNKGESNPKPGEESAVNLESPDAKRTWFLNEDEQRRFEANRPDREADRNFRTRQSELEKIRKSRRKGNNPEGSFGIDTLVDGTWRKSSGINRNGRFYGTDKEGREAEIATGFLPEDDALTPFKDARGYVDANRSFGYTDRTKNGDVQYRITPLDGEKGKNHVFFTRNDDGSLNWWQVDRNGRVYRLKSAKGDEAESTALFPPSDWNKISAGIDGEYQTVFDTIDGEIASIDIKQETKENSQNTKKTETTFFTEDLKENYWEDWEKDGFRSYESGLGWARWINDATGETRLIKRRDDKNEQPSEDFEPPQNNKNNDPTPETNLNLSEGNNSGESVAPPQEGGGDSNGGGNNKPPVFPSDSGDEPEGNGDENAGNGDDKNKNGKDNKAPFILDPAIKEAADKAFESADWSKLTIKDWRSFRFPGRDFRKDKYRKGEAAQLLEELNGYKRKRQEEEAAKNQIDEIELFDFDDEVKDYDASKYAFIVDKRRRTRHGSIEDYIKRDRFVKVDNLGRQWGVLPDFRWKETGKIDLSGTGNNPWGAYDTLDALNDRNRREVRSALEDWSNLERLYSMFPGASFKFLQMVARDAGLQIPNEVWGTYFYNTLDYNPLEGDNAQIQAAKDATYFAEYYAAQDRQKLINDRNLVERKLQERYDRKNPPEHPSVKILRALGFDGRIANFIGFKLKKKEKRAFNADWFGPVGDDATPEARLAKIRKQIDAKEEELKERKAKEKKLFRADKASGAYVAQIREEAKRTDKLRRKKERLDGKIKKHAELKKSLTKQGRFAVGSYERNEWEQKQTELLDARKAARSALRKQETAEKKKYNEYVANAPSFVRDFVEETRRVKQERDALEEQFVVEKRKIKSQRKLQKHAEKIAGLQEERRNAKGSKKTKLGNMIFKEQQKFFEDFTGPISHIDDAFYATYYAQNEDYLAEKEARINAGRAKSGKTEAKLHRERNEYFNSVVEPADKERERRERILENKRDEAQYYAENLGVDSPIYEQAQKELDEAQDRYNEALKKSKEADAEFMKFEARLKKNSKGKTVLDDQEKELQEDRERLEKSREQREKDEKARKRKEADPETKYQSDIERTKAAEEEIKENTDEQGRVKVENLSRDAAMLYKVSKRKTARQDWTEYLASTPPDGAGGDGDGAGFGGIWGRAGKIVPYALLFIGVEEAVRRLIRSFINLNKQIVDVVEKFAVYNGETALAARWNRAKQFQRDVYEGQALKDSRIALTKAWNELKDATLPLILAFKDLGNWVLFGLDKIASPVMRSISKPGLGQYGAVLGSAAGGTAVGALVGSIFGPGGTAVGGTIGGAIGTIGSSYIVNKAEKYQNQRNGKQEKSEKSSLFLDFATGVLDPGLWAYSKIRKSNASKEKQDENEGKKQEDAPRPKKFIPPFFTGLQTSARKKLSSPLKKLLAHDKTALIKDPPLTSIPSSGLLGLGATLLLERDKQSIEKGVFDEKTGKFAALTPDEKNNEKRRERYRSEAFWSYFGINVDRPDTQLEIPSTGQLSAKAGAERKIEKITQSPLHKSLNEINKQLEELNRKSEKNADSLKRTAENTRKTAENTEKLDPKNPMLNDPFFKWLQKQTNEKTARANDNNVDQRDFSQPYNWSEGEQGGNYGRWAGETGFQVSQKGLTK